MIYTATVENDRFDKKTLNQNDIISFDADKIINIS